MSHERKPLSGRRIGFFGKGGSGKSTTVVLLAQALQRKGYEVRILDADSTNLGLHRALGIDEAPAPLIDYFGGMVFQGGRVTCPVDDPTPLDGAQVPMGRIPAKHYAQNKEGIFLMTAGKIGDQGPGAGCDGPVAKIARDFRIEEDGENPVTLLDFKAGFEDSARGAVTGVDWVVVVVDPTTAAIQMAGHMRQMVDQIKAGVLPATQHLETPELVEAANRVFRESKAQDVLVILNRVGDEEMERYAREKLAESGIEPIGVIPEDRSIANAWLRGTPLNVTGTQEKTDAIVQRLEAVAQGSPAPA